MRRHTFRAMGTEIELLVDGEDAQSAFDAAEAEFHRLEAILSRFRENSELSQLNRLGELAGSPDLVRLTELALEAREETAGRFDPTVHDALVAAGYDKTFDQVEADGPPISAAICAGDVRIANGAISLGPNVKLDFGGIGKGYAAERAAEILATAGPCLVNAGGDIAIRGGTWPIGAATAEGSITLELGAGALATSGCDRRRWRRGGSEVHHLIDPITGTSADGDLLRVTVVASDAIAGEVWAKALFLSDASAAAAEANQRRLPSILVTASGRTIFAGGLA